MGRTAFVILADELLGPQIGNRQLWRLCWVESDVVPLDSAVVLFDLGTALLAELDSEQHTNAMRLDWAQESPSSWV